MLQQSLRKLGQKHWHEFEASLGIKNKSPKEDQQDVAVVKAPTTILTTEFSP